MHPGTVFSGAEAVLISISRQHLVVDRLSGYAWKVLIVW
jgi:hypothetical protein